LGSGPLLGWWSLDALSHSELTQIELPPLSVGAEWAEGLELLIDAVLSGLDEFNQS